MSSIAWRVFCAALLVTAVARAEPASPAGTYAFTGGLWFDGSGFVARTLYSVGGRFTAEPPQQVDETVDLEGLFVMPPFGDAHAHHFDSPELFGRINSTYLEEGIFYGVSMTNWIGGKRQVLPLVERPETLDVAFADAGITATLGHPIMVYETLARGLFDFDHQAVERAREPQAEGEAYFVVDDADELAQQWDAIIASGPQLLKVYLVFSDEYEKRKGWTESFGDRGLDPALVPLIVERARAVGLRVAAHVENVADFRVAVASGVDIVAHLPGYSPDRGVALERYRLSADDARAAAERRVIVVPTPLSSAAQRYEKEAPEFLARVRGLHRHNLEVLHAAGVEMAIGTDSYLTSSSRDAFLLHELGLFSNLELLRMWCETTPALAFPERRIGRLEPGWEASFVALEGDPLVDFSAVRSIAYRFKQGRPLGISE